jgi:hypothetical protein
VKVFNMTVLAFLLLGFGCAVDQAPVPPPDAPPTEEPGPTLPEPEPVDPGHEEPGCAEIEAKIEPVKPIVWLVLDGSTSMDQAFDAGRTRWDVLREVVSSLPPGLTYASVTYSAGNAECFEPLITEPGAVIDLPEDPTGSGTPTVKALELVATLVRPEDRVLLVTDGAANRWCDATGNNVVDEPEERRKVEELARTLHFDVVSLASGEPWLSDHLQRAADNGGRNLYVPTTAAEFEWSVRDAVYDVPCEFELNGKVEGGQGRVEVDGEPLDADSWTVQGNTLTLLDPVCESFKVSGGAIKAVFPCGTLIPE